MKLSNSFKLIISLILPHFAGFVGSKFAIVGITTWYDMLSKPTLTPPAWVFGPVWIILYTLMGIALYLVWKREGKRSGVGIAIWLFCIQLALNIIWPFFFFFKQLPDVSFVVIGILWLFVFFTIISFFRVSKTSAFLLVPYILWLTFAGYLNYSICKTHQEIRSTLIVQVQKTIVS